MTEKTAFLVTGDRDNAGDFLIADSVERLVTATAPALHWERIRSSEPITAELRQRIRVSRGILLAGGPALRPGFDRAVFPHIDSLLSAGVPIGTLGIGWKGLLGERPSHYSRMFSAKTRSVLTQIDKSLGFSVRDRFTYDTLIALGMTQVVLTGCPVSYRCLVDPAIMPPPRATRGVLAVSVGALLGEVPALYEQTKTAIERAVNLWPGDVVVAFHHSLGRSETASVGLNSRNLALAGWLEQNGIGYVELGKRLDRLKAFYEIVDAHIGYRVHADLFCRSAGIPSVLIAEDGRGLGQSEMYEEPSMASHRHWLPLSAAQVALNSVGFARLNYRVPRLPDGFEDALRRLTASDWSEISTKTHQYYHTMRSFVEERFSLAESNRHEF